MQPDFLLEDQGDGWWHCPSPLKCFILDGPARVPDADGDFWLVRVEPAIEWNGEASLGERWGPDHPLAHPFEPTKFALVMAASRFGRIDPTEGRGSVPVYPVLGDASIVNQAHWVGAHGAKVRVVPPAP